MRMNLILFIPLLHTLPCYIPADVFTALTDTTCANILYDTIQVPPLPLRSEMSLQFRN